LAIPFTFTKKSVVGPPLLFLTFHLVPTSVISRASASCGDSQDESRWRDNLYCKVERRRRRSCSSRQTALNEAGGKADHVWFRGLSKSLEL
jgi:hypothetical protein